MRGEENVFRCSKRRSYTYILVYLDLILGLKAKSIQNIFNKYKKKKKNRVFF